MENNDVLDNLTFQVKDLLAYLGLQSFNVTVRDSGNGTTLLLTLDTNLDGNVGDFIMNLSKTLSESQFVEDQKLELKNKNGSLELEVERLSDLEKELTPYKIYYDLHRKMTQG